MNIYLPSVNKKKITPKNYFGKTQAKLTYFPVVIIACCLGTLFFLSLLFNYFLIFLFFGSYSYKNLEFFFFYTKKVVLTDFFLSKINIFFKGEIIGRNYKMKKKNHLKCHDLITLLVCVCVPYFHTIFRAGFGGGK